MRLRRGGFAVPMACMSLRFVPLLMAALFFPGWWAWAHTVPGMTVEAEFGPRREGVILVNVDPRLFLATPPTSMPPLPAAWWLEQDDGERRATTEQAIAFVNDTLTIEVGSGVMKGEWKIHAVDSATITALAPASAEVHLLAEHRGPLPPNGGDFRVRVAPGTPVPVLLLVALEGAADRKPQLVLAGESSRGFPLPEIPVAEELRQPQDGSGKADSQRYAPTVVAALGGLMLLCWWWWHLRKRGGQERQP